MMQKRNITAVIPCAGNGTRMYPLTLATPKEMLPVVHKGLAMPSLQVTILNLLEAGVKMNNILIVVSKEKQSIIDYFTRDYSSEISNLLNKGKIDIVEGLKQIPKLTHENFMYQKGPYGGATPLLSVISKIPVGNNILYVYPDDLFVAKSKNEFEQILSAYDKYVDKSGKFGGILSSLNTTDPEDKKKYAFSTGTIVKGSNGELLKVEDIVEKPASQGIEIDSSLASVSSYMFGYEILQHIKEAHAEFMTSNQKGEFMIQPIIMKMIAESYGVFALQIAGSYYDLGNPVGWANAVHEIANQ